MRPREGLLVIISRQQAVTSMKPPAAEANQCLAGPRTVRRLENHYRCEKVGRQHLKNLADAIDVYRILGPSS